MSLSRRSFLVGISAVPAMAALAAPARAGVAPVYANSGVAIDGTDPMSYFENSAPLQGSASITFDWNGAEWRFTDEAHRSTFAKNPEAYAPQYGGYCSWAVSQGYTAPTVPEAWRIVDGKLYLNFSRRVQRRWERDIPAHIAAGDVNWPRLIA